MKQSHEADEKREKDAEREQADRQTKSRVGIVVRVLEFRVEIEE